MPLLVGESWILIAPCRCCSWWNRCIHGQPSRFNYGADAGRLYAKLPENRLNYKICFDGLFRERCLLPTFFFLLCVILNPYSFIGITLPFMTHSSCSSTFIYKFYLISFIIYFIIVLPLFIHRCSGKKAYRASCATSHRALSVQFSWILVSSRREYYYFWILCSFPWFSTWFYYIFSWKVFVILFIILNSGADTNMGTGSELHWRNGADPNMTWSPSICQRWLADGSRVTMIVMS